MTADTLDLILIYFFKGKKIELNSLSIFDVYLLERRD